MLEKKNLCGQPFSQPQAVTVVVSARPCSALTAYREVIDLSSGELPSRDLSRQTDQG